MKLLYIIMIILEIAFIDDFNGNEYTWATLGSCDCFYAGFCILGLFKNQPLCCQILDKCKYDFKQKNWSVTSETK